MSEQTSDVAAGPVATGDRAGQLRTVNIRLFAVVAMIFIFVSSGAFGIEDMVSWSGPGLTILMLLAAARVLGHADGAGLLRARLGAARGGRLLRLDAARHGRVLGLSVRLVVVDLPVGRLGRLHRPGRRGTSHTWWPQLSGWELWLIGAGLIAVFAYTNIRGLNIIALSSVVFTIVIVAPFLS